MPAKRQRKQVEKTAHRGRTAVGRVTRRQTNSARYSIASFLSKAGKAGASLRWLGGRMPAGTRSTATAPTKVVLQVIEGGREMVESPKSFWRKTRRNIEKSTPIIQLRKALKRMQKTGRESVRQAERKVEEFRKAA